MHLLRAVPGSLPGGRHRGRTEFRILDRDARGTLLQQGTTAGEWRPLGAGDRPQSGAGRALSLRAHRKRMLQALAFYLFSAVLIASAVMVIGARNPVHSVLFLIL